MTLPVAPSHPKRLVYLGTPAMAVPPLEALIDAGFDVALVVSRADKRRGRGSDLSPSPVKAAALERGVPTTASLDEAREVGADLGVVVAYGRLIPTPLLEALPMVNIHFSLLPRWRGAAPVERAILAGDPTTGVCLMEVAPALDTGAIYARREVPIGDTDTLADVQAKLVAAGSALLIEELTSGLRPPIAQQGEPTYAEKLNAEDHRLRFERSAIELQRVIRLGRAWCCFRGRRLKVCTADLDLGPTARSGMAEGPELVVGQLRHGAVATGEGWLRLVEVQPEGKRPMAAEAWLNGVQPQPDERLD
ncbi:MAG: methionyl-tRNA formyltransferase [Actinomycetia bacterium]|nr:methionyl-tRNA formyltransferase [Actinomycetes bacterium]MCP5034584.1 methionyl-tRNA formyltransferase [Actinomycetes bacterium]